MTIQIYDASGVPAASGMKVSVRATYQQTPTDTEEGWHTAVLEHSRKLNQGIAHALRALADKIEKEPE